MAGIRTVKCSRSERSVVCSWFRRVCGVVEFVRMGQSDGIRQRRTLALYKSKEFTDN
jgi:hypothetical protein